MPEDKSKLLPQKQGFTEIELRAKHDNMFKIRAGVKQLQRGFYLTDQQMKELCKVGNLWRGYSDNQEFDKFKIKLQDKLYWGLPECIAKLKRDLNVE
jgi:hypothetical protein